MEVIPDIYLLESTKGSSIYLIKSEEIILIDASIPGRTKHIINEIKSLGINPQDVSHILLTHHDFDHIGNAKGLKDQTGAQLWASKEDIPFIQEEKMRPGLKGLLQLVLKIDKPVIDSILTEEQHPDSINVIPTPGHTPGHTAFLYKDALFVGDLALNRGGKLILAPGIFTDNKPLLMESLKRLNQQSFEWICPAHGKPLKRNNLNELIK